MIGTLIRRWLTLASAALLLCACTAPKHPLTLLVVSGWQDVNIGDIAHTPGLLHVLETYLPEAEIILWEKNVGEEVESFIRKEFPKVRIAHGTVDEKLEIESEEILAAFRDADMMIHGSGPYVVGQYNLEAWDQYTGGKPFGIFGVTVPNVNPRLKELLEKAKFIYTRETASLEVLEQAGLTGDHIGFIPDATFFFDRRDEDRALRFLEDSGLEEGKFICAIPRLRKTPYYRIRNRHLWTEQRIQEIEEHNAKHKEVDHAKLREAMIRWIRETGNKVLVCPEMTYEVDYMDELLIDPLPEDVKPYVIKRGYWLPNEAASVYARSAAVLSFECHSPIIAAANHKPFLYLRQPDDTIKGQMYYDLGYDTWIFEIEETEGSQIADRLMSIYDDEAASVEKVKESQAQIAEMYKDACERIKKWTEESF